jgi:O-antigen/teichoic acid export membrane protein
VVIGAAEPTSLRDRINTRLQSVIESATGGSEHKGLARGAGIAFLLQVGGAGIAFVLQVLLGRWTGAEGYGTYSYVVAWAGLLAVLTGLGLPATVLRFIPSFISYEDWSRLRGMLRVSSSITIAVSAGISALATLVVVGLSSNGGGIGWDTIVGLWIAPLLALLTLQQEVIRSFRRIALAYAPPLLLRPALVILGGAAYILSGHHLTGQAALWITAIAMVFMLGTQSVLFRRGLSPAIRSVRPRYDTRSWMKVALPLLLIASFAVVLSQTDIVMVGAILGKRQAGLYTAASKTSAVVGLVLVSVNAIAAPTFASLFAQDRQDALASLATRVAHWIFWPTLAISVVLTVAAKPVLGLFGSQFVSAHWILTVLLIGQLINAAAGSVGYLMTLTGHQREAAWVFGWVALVHIALNAIAITLFGTIGAAIATTISLSLWNIWLHTLVVRRLGLHPSVMSGRWSRGDPPSRP